MSMRLSEHATFHDLDNLAGSDGEPGRQDIGATNAQTDYVTMENFSRVSNCSSRSIAAWSKL